MSADKYPSIFSRQMEAIVYIFVHSGYLVVTYTVRLRTLEGGDISFPN